MAVGLIRPVLLVAAVYVTAVDDQNGTWQFLLSGTDVWVDVNFAVEGNSGKGLLLDANARLRFVPRDVHWNGISTLTFGAWDQSSGAVGTYADISVRGGSTAFSEANVTATITVYEVNDVPVRTAGVPVDISVAQDFANNEAISLGLEGLTYGPGGGSDESEQSLSYSITSIPSFITLWKFDGTTQVFTGTIDLEDLKGLKYKTVAGVFGAANLQWTVTDDGTTDGEADPQTLTETLSITVATVETAPTAINLTSVVIDENVSAGSTVATLSSVDPNDPSGTGFYTYAFADGDGDADNLSFRIVGNLLIIKDSPNYETKPSYTIRLSTTDVTNQSYEQLVTITVNNLDEVAPVITSGATALAIDENSGAGQVVYTATATDAEDISGGVTFSLKDDNDDDAAAFTIDEKTGAVTLVADPDFETQSSYSFTVVATDAAGNFRDQVVSLSINNLEEVPTSANASLNVTEDVPKILSLSSFVFVVQDFGVSLKGVRFTVLPTVGFLQLDTSLDETPVWSNVTAGQLVLVEDIIANKASLQPGGSIARPISHCSSR